MSHPSGIKDILIIIPAFNEERNIPLLIRTIQNKVFKADILIVDDGSQDRTSRVAEKTGVIVIRHPFNMGYGAALQTGFKYALMKRYRYVIQMDADGQHDPDYINALLDEVKKGDVDVVIGSRFLDPRIEYPAPAIRKIGIRLFSWVVSTITRQKITDPTSGFQALNRDALRYYASKYYPVDYPDADVIIMLHRAGLLVKEIPVMMHVNTEGKTMHSGLKPLYYIFKMFLSMFVTMLRKEKFEKRVVKDEKEEVEYAVSTEDVCNKY